MPVLLFCRRHFFFYQTNYHGQGRTGISIGTEQLIDVQVGFYIYCFLTFSKEYIELK